MRMRAQALYKGDQHPSDIVNHSASTSIAFYMHEPAHGPRFELCDGHRVFTPEEHETHRARQDAGRPAQHRRVARRRPTTGSGSDDGSVVSAEREADLLAALEVLASVASPRGSERALAEAAASWAAGRWPTPTWQVVPVGDPSGPCAQVVATAGEHAGDDDLLLYSHLDTSLSGEPATRRRRDGSVRRCGAARRRPRSAHRAGLRPRGREGPGRRRPRRVRARRRAPHRDRGAVRAATAARGARHPWRSRLVAA